MRRLLRCARWDADAVRGDIRAYAVEHLGTDGGALFVDETGFVKKGRASAGVQRQCPGIRRAHRELPGRRPPRLRHQPRTDTDRPSALPARTGMVLRSRTPSVDQANRDCAVSDQTPPGPGGDRHRTGGTRDRLRDGRRLFPGRDQLRPHRHARGHRRRTPARRLASARPRITARRARSTTTGPGSTSAPTDIATCSSAATAPPANSPPTCAGHLKRSPLRNSSGSPTSAGGSSSASRPPRARSNSITTPVRDEAQLGFSTVCCTGASYGSRHCKPPPDHPQSTETQL